MLVRLLRTSRQRALRHGDSGTRLYLALQEHHGCIPQIVNWDVKAHNIYFNCAMEPSLSDFGLSKIVGTSNTRICSTILLAMLWQSSRIQRTLTVSAWCCLS